MNEDCVLVSYADAVATVTVNRPGVLNALNTKTISKLRSVFLALRLDDAVRCVVLTGAGDRAFVAGADIAELASLGPKEVREFSEAGHRLCFLIEGLGKPVIAVLKGFVLGGGCEIAMASTLRISSSSARLGLPEISLGIIPGFGGTQRLPRLVGRGRALQMLLTGDPIEADEALRIGLVNRVVEPEKLVEEANRLASALAVQAPAAVRGILEAVGHGSDMSLVNASMLERNTFGLIYSSDDASEGVAAFLEKRKPEFTGR